jgi:hypothetical protein
MIGPEYTYGPHVREMGTNIGSNRTWGFLHQNVPGMARVGGSIRSYMGTAMHQEAMAFTKESFGIGKHLSPFGKWMGRGFVGLSAFMGYRDAHAKGKSGTWGAAKGVAEYATMNYGFKAVTRALGLGSTAGTIGAGITLGAIAQVGALTHMAQSAQGGGLGQFLARPAVYQHMRQHAMLEMGRPAVDMYGTASTMRQRSLAAIQDSKLNGRVALGLEGQIMYRPYFR